MLLKASAVVVFLASAAINVDGFSSTPSFLNNVQHVNKVSFPTSLSMVDPSAFNDLTQHLDSIQAAFSSNLLSDVDAIAAVAADPAVAVATDPGNGWFGFLTEPIEALLMGIHSGLVSGGINSNSWGLSIALLTLTIKLVTYPLTKQQLESTSKMQSLQPMVKEIQAKYASNAEVMNQKVSAVYKENEVNPLAGCLPAIVQLPVFIGLYRAVLTLAKENKLDEPFLWLPSLEGPTYGADPASGSQWILSGWVDGIPSLGWADTAAFLSIPIFLVISQSISQKLMQPKNQTDEQAEQANNIVIKLLPLLIGWFSLNVPSALGIYWVSNNLITTALTVQIRSALDANPPQVGVSSGGGATMSVPTPTTSSAFTPAPLREKPAGFASAASEGSDDITPITAMAIDAEVVDDVNNEPPLAPKSKSKKRGKKKRRKS